MARSFAAVTAGGRGEVNRRVRSYASVTADGVPNFPPSFYDDLDAGSASSFVRRPGRKGGKLALFLSDSENGELASACRLHLVGKFLYGVPKLDFLRHHFELLKLTGDWKIGPLDGRHILIQLANEEDYTRLFARRMIWFHNIGMKVLKWSSNFDPKEEAPVIPVWIRFPFLKVHLFHHEILFSLAAMFGRPLKLDVATHNLTRPSVARVLIERDVTLPPPDEVWIGSENIGYWQEVCLENHPPYCKHCFMFGHDKEHCFKCNPELRRKEGRAEPLGDVPAGVPSTMNDNQGQNVAAGNATYSQRKNSNTIGNSSGIVDQTPVTADLQGLVPSSPRQDRDINLQEAPPALPVSTSLQVFDSVLLPPPLTSTGNDELQGIGAEALQNIDKDLSNIHLSSSHSIPLSTGDINKAGNMGRGDAPPPTSSVELREDGRLSSSISLPDVHNFENNSVLTNDYDMPTELPIEDLSNVLREEWQVQRYRRRKKTPLKQAPVKGTSLTQFLSDDDNGRSRPRSARKDNMSFYV